MQQVNWQQVFAYFGCNLQLEISTAKSHDEAAKILDSLKDRARTTYKKMAFECHPDRNQGDDTKIKELNSLYDLVKNAKYQPPPPMLPMIRVVMHPGAGWGWGGTTNTSTTTSATYTNTWW